MEAATRAQKRQNPFEATPSVYAMPPPAYDAVPTAFAGSAASPASSAFAGSATYGPPPVFSPAASSHALRVAVLRLDAVSGHLIALPGDLATLKQAAGAKLGITVASLWLGGRFEVTDVTTLKDLDELVALTDPEDTEARSAASRKRTRVQ